MSASCQSNPKTKVKHQQWVVLKRKMSSPALTLFHVCVINSTLWESTKQTTTNDACLLYHSDPLGKLLCAEEQLFIQEMCLSTLQVGFLGFWLLFRRKEREKKLLMLWVHSHILCLQPSHIRCPWPWSTQQLGHFTLDQTEVVVWPSLQRHSSRSTTVYFPGTALCRSCYFWVQ